MKRSYGVLIRRSTRIAATFFFGVLAFGSGELTAQTEEPAPARSEILSRPDQNLIDEINAIRRQLGGGIAEELKGLNLGNHVENQLREDFDQELNRLAARRQALSIVGSPRLGPDRNKWHDSRNDLFSGETSENNLNISRSVAPSGLTPIHPRTRISQSLQIKKLRLSARRLDEIAAELEEVGLYEEADSIRGQARNFWLKARHFGIHR